MFVASGRPLLTELMACRRFLCTVHARESTCIITACVVSLQTLLLLKTRTLRLNENLWQVQRKVIACAADVISARLHLPVRSKRRPITKAPMSVSLRLVTPLFPALSVAVSKGMVGGRIYRQFLGVIACTADVIST